MPDEAALRWRRRFGPGRGVLLHLAVSAAVACPSFFEVGLDKARHGIRHEGGGFGVLQTLEDPARFVKLAGIEEFPRLRQLGLGIGSEELAEETHHAPPSSDSAVA